MFLIVIQKIKTGAVAVVLRIFTCVSLCVQGQPVERRLYTQLLMFSLTVYHDDPFMHEA